MTQKQFAQKVEPSVQFVGALENGMKFAHMDTYCKITDILKMPLPFLFISQQSQKNILDEQHQNVLCDCNMD